MTAPTSDQLRKAWTVERHDHHTSSNGWDTCPVCALRAALALLADAERRIEELERDTAALIADAEVAHRHIEELIRERDQAWLDHTATSDMLDEARERNEAIIAYANTNLRASLADAERRIEKLEHNNETVASLRLALAAYDALTTKETP